MNKILASKGWWLFLLIVLLGINYLASVVHTRVDLTQEKRYTLSPATKKLVKDLHDKVSITVLLTGDMPHDPRSVWLFASGGLDHRSGIV